MQAMQETWFSLWVRKIPWRSKWQPTPVFLLRKSHRQRSPSGYSPWEHKRVGHTLATEQQQFKEPKRVTTRLLTRQKPHYISIKIYLPEKLAHACARARVYVCVWVCGRRGGLASLPKETSVYRSHTGLFYYPLTILCYNVRIE